MSFHNEMPGGPPLTLSRELANAVANAGDRFDIAISQVPFRLWPSQQDPYVRDYRQGQKEQFDTSGEAGENSFGSWWLRSQSTFHGGSGQDYLDATGSDISRLLYSESSGLVNTKPGELTVSPQVYRLEDYGSSEVVLTQWSAVDKLVYSSNSTNQVTVREVPDLTLDQNVTIGATGTPASIATDGERVFVAIADKIYRVDPGSPATVVNTHTNLTFSGTVKLGFAKDRLICAVGPDLYELDPAPAAPVDMSAVTPHYTNNSSGWAYTSIIDGPNGIYLTGFSGHNSYMSQMTVEEASGTLTLGQPIVQITLPPGEIIQDAMFYVGSHFALATNSGVRIGSFTPYGQPQIGPLSVDGAACFSLGASRELIWAGGVDALFRVDLSTPVDQAGRFAASKYQTGFCSATSQHVPSLVIYPDTTDRVFGTTSAGHQLYTPSFTYDDAGTLTTSWVRFDTVEPKQLHYVRIDGDFPALSIGATATVKVESDAGESTTFAIQGGKSTYEFATSGLLPAQLFRLVFTINDESTGQGVKVRSWQMKALPAARAFGEHVIPLGCYDSETDRFGKDVGYKGFCADRLRALEEIAATNQRITVTDRLLDESYQAIIERCQFRQDDKPDSKTGMGGVVSVVLRKV